MSAVSVNAAHRRHKRHFRLITPDQFSSARGSISIDVHTAAKHRLLLEISPPVHRRLPAGANVLSMTGPRKRERREIGLARERSGTTKPLGPIRASALFRYAQSRRSCSLITRERRRFALFGVSASVSARASSSSAVREEARSGMGWRDYVGVVVRGPWRVRTSTARTSSGLLEIGKRPRVLLLRRGKSSCGEARWERRPR